MIFLCARGLCLGGKWHAVGYPDLKKVLWSNAMLVFHELDTSIWEKDKQGKLTFLAIHSHTFDMFHCKPMGAYGSLL